MIAVEDKDSASSDVALHMGVSAAHEGVQDGDDVMNSNSISSINNTNDSMTKKAVKKFKCRMRNKFYEEISLCDTTSDYMANYFGQTKHEFYNKVLGIDDEWTVKRLLLHLLSRKGLTIEDYLLRTDVSQFGWHNSSSIH